CRHRSLHVRFCCIVLFLSFFVVCFFFFSSRRRHTRLVSDWSSDVCSSDLLQQLHDLPRIDCAGGCWLADVPPHQLLQPEQLRRRSGERRVGKEGRSGGGGGHLKKKNREAKSAERTLRKE